MALGLRDRPDTLSAVMDQFALRQIQISNFAMRPTSILQIGDGADEGFASRSVSGRSKEINIHVFYSLWNLVLKGCEFLL